MKFARTDLIKRVRDEITRRQVATEEANAAARERAARERDEYVDRTGDAWLTFANTIRQAYAERRPVTRDDVPPELRDGYLDRIALRRFEPPAERTPNTASLAALLALLESATDDVVTTSALQQLGFRSGELFRAAEVYRTP